MERLTKRQLQLLISDVRQYPERIPPQRWFRFNDYDLEYVQLYLVESLQPQQVLHCYECG